MARVVRVMVALLAFAACRGSSEPATAGSGSGGSVGAPRIVTLSPSATEVVVALGATTWLVGVDNYSDYPADVMKDLPKVGTFIAPNLETIVRLRPTLVIVDDVHGQQAAALGDRGIVTIECAMHALPDVKAALHSVGAKLGKTAEADAVSAAIDKALDDYAAKKPTKHPRVLAVIDREADGLGNIVAAGPGSLVDELIAVVGGDNVLTGASTRYPKISTEEVLRAQPDVILDLSYSGKDNMKPWNELDVPAVKAKRVKSLTDGLLSHPSPRVAQQLELLANALR
jgi:iron complex transport system substrate-binding protein